MTSLLGIQEAQVRSILGRIAEAKSKVRILEDELKKLES
jgi:hypothetical protein